MEHILPDVDLKTENFKAKSVASLTKQCQQFILKFTHNIVWRTLDPPNPRCSEAFKPKVFPLDCQLPEARQCEERDSEEFRRRLKIIRSYFSDNLVRPVYNKLTEKCQKFVTENLLQHGDIILQLIFQDDLSKSLSVTAKHIVYRRWSIREERTLQRYLNTSSQNIVRLSLPGKVDDKILGLIATNCRLLEELDLSSSYMTDTGLLALCGVEVSQVEEAPGQSSRPLERGSVDAETGKFVRAAASRAKRSIRTICANHQQNSFLQELAQGTSDLEAKFPHLAKKIKPLIVKREDESYQHSWAGEDGLQYSFTDLGCRRLRKLDLWATSYPKKMITRYGDILTVGVTQEAVLASLILVIMRSCHNKRMRELNRKWPGLSWLYGGGKQNTFEKLYLNFTRL